VTLCARPDGANTDAKLTEAKITTDNLETLIVMLLGFMALGVSRSVAGPCSQGSLRRSRELGNVQDLARQGLQFVLSFNALHRAKSLERRGNSGAMGTFFSIAIGAGAA